MLMGHKCAAIVYVLYATSVVGIIISSVAENHTPDNKNKPYCLLLSLSVSIKYCLDLKTQYSAHNENNRNTHERLIVVLAT